MIGHILNMIGYLVIIALVATLMPFVFPGVILILLADAANDKYVLDEVAHVGLIVLAILVEVVYFLWFIGVLERMWE